MSRLNKVSRLILFKYCTFSQAYRDTLSSNPQYTQLISKWMADEKSKLQTLGFLRAKLQRPSGAVPPDVGAEIAYAQL